MKYISKFVIIFIATLFSFALLISCQQEVNEVTQNYTVTYKTDYGVAPEAISVAEDSVLSEKQLPALTNNDHIFVGWFDGETKVEAGNYKVTKDITLVAKWNDIFYTVTFNSLGGSEVESKKVKKGNKITRPQNPTKEGSETVSYSFIGWYTSNNNGVTLLQPFDFNTQITGDIILYAKWTESTIYYTVTFNSNGGSNVSSQTVRGGGKATVPVVSPTKTSTVSTSYTFAGWFTSTDNGITLSNTAFDFANTTITSPITLYAKWTETAINYTVTFDSKGGSTVASTQVRGGNKLTAPTNPTKNSTVSTSYTFAGWFTSTDNGITLSNTPFDFLNTTITKSITLYAKWTESPVYYTVTFDSKGGSSVTSLQLRWGDTINKPSNPIKEQFGLTSYAFDNWYTSTDNGITLSNTAFDFVNSTITKSITLYAKWIESQSEYQFHEIVEYLPRYTNGTAGTSSKYVLFGDWPQTIKAASVTVDENQSMTMGDFTYYKGSDGYWYVKCIENAQGTEQTYSDGTSVVQLSANSTKYFKVEPIKWRVLNPNATGTEKKLLLAESILTGYSYTQNRKAEQANNYQRSDIRTYLKTTFLNEAFTTNAQDLIANTSVDNSARSTNPDSNATLWNNGNNPNVCPKVSPINPEYDKIFLLSMQEVTKSAYGFAEYNKYGSGNARIRVPTDYAKANYVWQQNSPGWFGGSWWTRSPYYDDIVFVHEVDASGGADMTTRAYYNGMGVVPALCLN